MPIAATSAGSEPVAVEALLREQLGNPLTAWSLGSFGAIAEYMRDLDEDTTRLDDGRLGAFTARGAIAFTPVPGLRPLAYETPINSGWSQSIALCLPEEACAMNRRKLVTELGPDRDAARPEDREAILFDLGLDLLAVDACVRSSDPETVDCLRASVGLPLFDHASPILMRLVALSPHRVFLSRIGRVEVYSRIPAPGGTSPEGPHTHVLPKLLRAGRTHAATTPIPSGWVPCAGIHPAHPYKNELGQRVPFDQARYEAFQALLDRWGDPELVAIKRGAPHADDSVISSRHAQAARRVAQAQAAYLRGEIIEDAPEDEDEQAVE